MTIIQRLIAILWLKIFIACFSSLFAVAALGDIINNMMRNKYTMDLVFENFIVNSASFMSKIIPFSCLLASLFLIQLLKNHSELIAILASGFGKKQILRVILFTGALAGLLQFYVVGYVDPYLENKKKNIQTEMKSQTSESVSSFSNDKVWIKNKKYITSYTFYYHQEQKMQSPSILYFDEKYHLAQLIEAKEAIYLKENLWTLWDATIYDYLNTNNEFPNVKRLPKYQVRLDEKPEDFHKFQNNIMSLNFIDMFIFLKNLKNSGININEYFVSLYDKIATTLICILFALFPFVGLKEVNKRSGSSAKSIVASLTVMIFFWGIYYFMIGLGSQGILPPLVSTMIIPSAVSIYLFKLYLKQEKSL